MSRKSLIISVVAAVVATILVVAGAVHLLRSAPEAETTPEGAASTTSAGTATTSAGEVAGPVLPSSVAVTTTASAETKNAAELGQRPDCPSTGVAGLELACLGGATGKTPQDKGVQLVSIWAWWCGPCREELPYLQSYADSHPDVEVVGVHVDEDAAGGAHLLNELGIDLASYQDPERKLSSTLGVPPVLPVSVLVVDGVAVEASPGYFKNAEDIDTFVTGVLARVK